jgi:hypothetical protein
VDSRRRFIVGGWLIVSCLVLLAGARVAWAHETSTRRTVVVTPAPRVVHESSGLNAVAMSVGHGVTTGHGANHIPALLLLIVGGAAGIGGVALIRSHAAETTGRDQSA